MTSITHFLLSDSLAVNIDGDNFLISSADHRYERACEAIREGRLEDLPLILDATKSLNVDGFEVIDGLLSKDSQPMPMALTDRVVENRVQGASIAGLINFWFNKNKRNEEISAEITKRMSGDIFYSLTEDGFFFCFSGKKSFKSDSTFFLATEEAPQVIKNLLEQKLSLNKIAEEIFGFSDKKIIKEIVLASFSSEAPRWNIFTIGRLLKGLIPRDNFFTLWDKLKTQETTLDLESADIANNVLKNYSPLKITNLLSVNDSLNTVHEIGLKLGETDIEIPATIKISSLADLLDLIERESIKRTENFDLNQESINPSLTKIDGLSVDETLSIVIPKTQHDLALWSLHMGNCIGKPEQGYGKRASKGETILIGLTEKNGAIKHTIEVKNGAIKQFESKHLRSAPKKIRSLLASILKDNGLIS